MKNRGKIRYSNLWELIAFNLMSGKTIFIIVITILVTVILMNNTDEIDFWIFGVARIPKLAILGAMFVTGFVLGFLAGRPRKNNITVHEHPSAPADFEPEDNRSKLSDEDRDYIN